MTILYRPNHYALHLQQNQLAMSRSPTFLGRIADVMRRWHERRARYLAALALRRLDDRMLKDIGVDRSEIDSVVYTGGRGRPPILMNRR